MVQFFGVFFSVLNGIFSAVVGLICSNFEWKFLASDRKSEKKEPNIESNLITFEKFKEN